jgi:uncharacterized protein affecting Mg2+/Co2+ transport
MALDKPRGEALNPLSEPATSRRAMIDDYAKTTRGIRVSVRSFYLEDQSEPDESHFVWAYRVKIENQGREPVQLLRRTWRITDARGKTQHVDGDGVVGERPLLEPGESFEYTSGTPLGLHGRRLSHGCSRVGRDLRRGHPGVQPGQPAPERPGALTATWLAVSGPGPISRFR